MKKFSPDFSSYYYVNCLLCLLVPLAFQFRWNKSTPFNTFFFVKQYYPCKKRPSSELKKKAETYLAFRIKENKRFNFLPSIKILFISC